MSEWILAFATLTGAGLYLRATFKIPELLIGDAVGPQFFPALIGAGLLLSGVLLLLEAWRKTPVAAVPGAAAMVPGDGSKIRLTLIAVAGWTALYYAVFEPLGYIPATLIYIFALLTHFHRTRWWWNALITIGFTAIAYVLFAKLLNVALPNGLLAGVAGL